MVIQRRPANAMAPDPVAIANAMAALQPRVDIGERVQKVPPMLTPRDKQTMTKKHKNEKQDYGITAEEYDKWRRDPATAEYHLREYSYAEPQERAGAVLPGAQGIIGDGSGFKFDNNGVVIDPMAIDRDYRALRDAGLPHAKALEQVYHAYGYNGYAYSNLPKDWRRMPGTDFYPPTKWDLRNMIRPYDPDLVG